MTPRVTNFESYTHREAIVGSYADWVEQLIEEGWKPYLLTFMFDQLPGPASTRRQAMIAELERVYSTLVTRSTRKPRSTPSTRLPLWICCPDFPVWKREKSSLCDATINDGEHYHAIVLIPPWSRLREDLEKHFKRFADMYVSCDHTIKLIHVQPIVDTLRNVVGYVHKAIRLNRAELADIIVFPRSLSELGDGPALNGSEGTGSGMSCGASQPVVDRNQRRSRTFAACRLA